MASKPVVIIPPRSPRLEAIALAVLWGAADEGRTIPVPLVVADPAQELPSVADAPRVFLGWRADLEESRQLAAQTLAALVNSGGPSRQIATFEVSLRGSSFGPTESLPDEGRSDSSNGTALGPKERFLIDRGTGGDSAGLLELARARRWGAQTYSQWHPAPPAGPPEPRPEDAAPSISRSLPGSGTPD